MGSGEAFRIQRKHIETSCIIRLSTACLPVHLEASGPRGSVSNLEPRTWDVRHGSSIYPRHDLLLIAISISIQSTI